WVARVPDAVQGDVARHYAASVMHLDDAVGRILGALERRGRRENTLVVFTSDNGGSTVENNDLQYPDDHWAAPRKLVHLKWKSLGKLEPGGTREQETDRWRSDSI